MAAGSRALFSEASRAARQPPPRPPARTPPRTDPPPRAGAARRCGAWRGMRLPSIDLASFPIHRRRIRPAPRLDGLEQREGTLGRAAGQNEALLPRLFDASICDAAAALLTVL